MEKNKNVPKLRFKDDNNKDFPDWKEKTLGEVANTISSGKSKTKDCVGEYPLYGSTGIIGYRSKYDYCGINILIARVGANAGSLYVVDGKYSISDNTLVLNLDNNTDVFFIYNLLIKCNLNKMVFGSGQPLVTGGQIKNMNIMLPSLSEQQKIASYLTAVDKKLTQLKKKKTLLEQYKKGIMQKLFSQELRFKDNNNQDFPDWQEKTLGEISDVRDGTHESPQYYDYGFPFITSKNLLKDGNIDFDNVSYINEHDFNRFNFRSKVDVNDILFAMIGTIGNPVLVSKDGFAIKNVALIKEKGNLLNIFLIHYMKGPSINQQFFEQNTGGTQKFLSLSVIKNLIVAVPSLPEQQKIATFLSSIDEKISHSSAQIEKMETWKKGLLQQMFV